MDIIFLLLLISFIGAFFFGLIIIKKQVALIKKGEFSYKDRLNCVIYGIIFALAVLIVEGMGFIIAIESPDYWTNTTPPEFHSEYFLIPFIICLFYISIYPLIDFLHMALIKTGDEGLTPFHKFFGEKIINKTNNKVINILIAICFYAVIFIIPPIVLSRILFLPFLVVWISWMLIYPLLIICFYGARGHIAVLLNAFYHIPDIKRLFFYEYENDEKIRIGLKEGLSPRIVIGFMLFVYVWSWISLIQTTSFYFTKTIPITFAFFSGYIFVSLFFGILGYFIRFWGRKTTYKGIDIYFSAYLIAAIGINILIKALLVNYDKLEGSFDFWELTREIIPNYYMLAWAAAIEEIFILTFTSYYFLSKKSHFKDQLKFSKVIESGRSFDPWPLFHFLKSKDIKTRTRAKITLQMMYENIRTNKDINLNDFKYKIPILKGITDPDAFTRDVFLKILTELINTTPDKVIPWMINILERLEYDKIFPFSESILSADINLIKNIPYNLILKLLNDSDCRLKLTGLKFFSKIISFNKVLINDINISELLENPDPNVQAETLNLLTICKRDLPLDVILSKLKCSNSIIRAGIVKHLYYLEELHPDVLKILIDLINDQDNSVKACIFKILVKLGDFQKNSIPIKPFLEGLIDLNKNIRDSSIKALELYSKEEMNWDKIDIDFIMDRIDKHTNLEVLKTIVSFFNKSWKYNPEKMMKSFIFLMKLQNDEINKYISGILILKSETHLDLVIRNITDIPDVSRYFSKGFLTKIIASITRDKPLDFIPQLVAALGSKDENENFEWIPTLKRLSKEYPELNKVITVFSKIGEKQMDVPYFGVTELYVENPIAFKSEINKTLEKFPQQIPSTKMKQSNSFLNIANKSPDILSLTAILNFLMDPIEQVREAGAEILGIIGNRNPEKCIADLFIFGLHDESSMVREISISSISKIIFNSENKSILINDLVPHLEDANIWIRIAVSNLIADFKKEPNIDVPLNLVLNNIHHEDQKVREASSGLLSIFAHNNIDSIFDHILSLLGDDSVYVRNKTIIELTEIIKDIGLNKIISQLLKNLSDAGSVYLQCSIALVLEDASRDQNEDIRNRIISLLKIRCEMSQDPTICGVFHRMKENLNPIN